MSDIIRKAREVIDIEIEGLKALRDNLNGNFEKVVEACLATQERGGKLVLTGVGKSGYIGQKIAATLSSIGSPSVFMHPVEALHGDLGIMQSNDIVVALSYSGETEELLAVLNPAKRLGMKIIAITGCAGSRLSALCDITLEMPVEREACPFNLAPTTTTTALLALGDALAMVLLQKRGFTREDYGRLHPGGAIGRAVTMQIKDIMRAGERYATVAPETKVKDTLLHMTSARCGCAIIVNDKQELLGIFTDGDFRRHAEKSLDVLEQKVEEVMTSNPVFVRAESLAAEALKVVEDRKINDIVVVDKAGRVVGMIDVQDLPGLKLM
ncbi:KpsF/GutQ family sugar-phosphate isomerase [Lentisphaerota bacterium ZTH]|nr:KpsF/GutQ family sugar-phosphate isomerase [Lentisphaerota bacterium]WET06612.1 KpsF/GutQ family sugar-phosphate isomerase [Lentisphaerota bacterium ZTH]